jgi:Dyp-type peroxidase family
MTLLSEQELRDIQGLVLSGYGHLEYASFIYFRIDDGAAARRLLGTVLDRISDAGPWERRPDGTKVKPQVVVNLAFTHTGFEALGLPPDTLNSFSREFIVGMAERAPFLGDDGPSDPETWEVGGPHNERLDALMMLYGASSEVLEQWRAEHREFIRQTHGGIKVIDIADGCRHHTPMEPFGFRDGISQPTVEAVTHAPTDPNLLIKTGEFVLGYEDEYGKPPPSPAVADSYDPENVLPPFPKMPGLKDFGHNGTYLAYRRLEQDVAGFWKYMEEMADAGPGACDAERRAAVRLLASKCVGRWPSGAPLVLAPLADDPVLGADQERSNGFTFQPTDREGFACPVGSHIRRANPRDALLGNDPAESFVTTKRHRIIRRGIPYGAPLILPENIENPNVPTGLEDDGGPRGLHFFAINANLKRQFEFMQQEWLNNAQFDGLYDSRDPVAGDNGGKGSFVVQRAPVRREVAGIERFVRTKGGGYFFMPSLRALRYLAQTP